MKSSKWKKKVKKLHARRAWLLRPWRVEEACLAAHTLQEIYDGMGTDWDFIGSLSRLANPLFEDFQVVRAVAACGEEAYVKAVEDWYARKADSLSLID